MKFALKSLVAAAAMVAAGVTSAAPVTGTVGVPVVVNDPAGSGRTAELTLISGGGALAFSSGSNFDPSDTDTLGGLMGALNVGNVQMSGVGGATYQEGFTPDVFGDPVRTSAVANAAVVSLTADNQTGQVLSVGSTGGALQVGSRIPGTLNGGSASVTNLRFDLANNMVYADLIGRSNAVGTRPAVDYQLLNTALWEIGSVSGPTVIPPAALLGSNVRAGMEAAGFTYIDEVDGLYTFSATNVISGLKVTDEGFDFFVNSLGLLSTGVNALRAVNDDPMGWGTVASNMIFTVREVTPAIPEPSTYAMTVMGLAVVGALGLRRRRS